MQNVSDKNCGENQNTHFSTFPILCINLYNLYYDQQNEHNSTGVF